MAAANEEGRVTPPALKPRRVLLAWSGGKDAAASLWRLQTSGVEVVGLLTTVGEDDGAVTMHGIPDEILTAQAAAVGLPLCRVRLPDPCPNDVYGARMQAALKTVPAEVAVAFGDLFLADVRAYREARLADAGRAGVFPLWGQPTGQLAAELIDGGFRAIVCTVDRDALDDSFVGRPYDRQLLADLPAGVDPCGERGEFHTCVVDGPIFAFPLPVVVAGVSGEGRFAHAQLALDQ